MPHKFASTIKGAAVLLFSLTLISRGFGFLREILTANYFGAGTELEVYLVGAVLPIILNTVIFYISQNYFIPVYNGIKSKGDNEHFLFTSNLFWTFVILSAVISLLLFTFSGYIISFYLGTNSGPQFEQARFIFNLLLITIPVSSGYAVLAGYLNAEFIYLNPAAAQLFWNIAQILILVFFYDILNIFALPAALLAGYFLQLAYGILASRKNIRFNLNISLIKNLTAVKSGSALLFIVAIEFINQLYSLLDRYYYANVQQGGIASLNYANIIYQLPLSVVSLVFVTIMFPKLSEAYSSRNFKALKSYYTRGLLYNLIIYTPIIIIFFFFGDIIIRILFERGKFSSYDTQITFYVLQIYTVSLLFYSSYAIISKVIFSVGLMRQLLIISIICLVSKVLLNAILVETYQQNGLAIATSASLTIMSILGFLAVHYKLKTLKSV